MGEGKGCVLCRNGLDKFGYRDVLLLRQFLTPEGLIIGRRQTGMCSTSEQSGVCRVDASPPYASGLVYYFLLNYVYCRDMSKDAEQDHSCNQKIKKNGYLSLL